MNDVHSNLDSNKIHFLESKKGALLFLITFLKSNGMFIFDVDVQGSVSVFVYVCMTYAQSKSGRQLSTRPAKNRRR